MKLKLKRRINEFKEIFFDFERKAIIMKCESLDEVRENIDRIDRKIVKLIAERSTYVAQAANFKKDSDDVKAPQRVEKIINKVRDLASKNYVNPDIVEKIYREMIKCFTNYELVEHGKLVQKDRDKYGI